MQILVALTWRRAVCAGSIRITAPDIFHTWHSGHGVTGLGRDVVPASRACAVNHHASHLWNIYAQQHALYSPPLWQQGVPHDVAVTVVHVPLRSHSCSFQGITCTQKWLSIPVEVSTVPWAHPVVPLSLLRGSKLISCPAIPGHGTKVNSKLKRIPHCSATDSQYHFRAICVLVLPFSGFACFYLPLPAWQVSAFSLLSF